MRTFTATTLSFLILLFNAVVTFLRLRRRPLVDHALAVPRGGRLRGVRLGGDHLAGPAAGRTEQPPTAKRRRTSATAWVAFANTPGPSPSSAAKRRRRLGWAGGWRLLVANFRAIIVVSRNLGFFTTAVQLPAADHSGGCWWRRCTSGAAASSATVTQAAMAFSQLLGGVFADRDAVSEPVVITPPWSAGSASLWEATEPVAAPAARSEEGGVRKTPPAVGSSSLLTPHSSAPPGPAVEIIPDGRQLSYEGVTLWTPGEHRPLVRDLTLDVPEGKRLVVTGRAGPARRRCCWPPPGCGERVKAAWSGPAPATCVSCRSSRTHRAGGCGTCCCTASAGKDVPTKRLLDVLHEVGLEGRAIEGGLDAERDWSRGAFLGRTTGLGVRPPAADQPAVRLPGRHGRGRWKRPAWNGCTRRWPQLDHLHQRGRRVGPAAAPRPSSRIARRRRLAARTGRPMAGRRFRLLSGGVAETASAAARPEPSPAVITLFPLPLLRLR